MQVLDWLAAAIADAEARGLAELRPMLETLARSTQALRDADGEFHHPAGEHLSPDTADDGSRITRNPQDSARDDGSSTD